jgi:hypothetical protein
MSNGPKKLSALFVANSFASSDRLVILVNAAGNAVTQTITANTLFAPTTYFQNTAPITSKGKIGDTKGMFSVDTNYFYYCIANFIGDNSNIWNRIAPSNTSW